MAVEKKRINIYVPVELYTKLKQIVDCWGSSVNGYLVWLIGNEVYDFEQFSKQENLLDDSKLVRPSFTDVSEKTCYLEYKEWIPSGGDEADLSWDWTCSNCDADLTDRYEDLDIKTPRELGLFYCPRCGARILGTRYRKDDDSER